MTTVTRKKLLTDHLPFSGAPYGNSFVQKAVLETTAAGALVSGDNGATPLAIGDKVRFAVIPAGTELNDALAIVSTAFTAATTAKIGFEYVDGVDVAAVPQDDDYFFAALATNAVGRTRATNTGVRPVTLPKDAYLIATVAGAAHAKAGALDLIIEGRIVGQP